MQIQGMSMVFTGAMRFGVRSKLEDLCRQRKGYVDAKLNGNTNYLVVGKRPGKLKLNFANSSMVEVVSEDEFYRACGIDVPLPSPPVKKLSAGIGKITPADDVVII